MEASPIELKSDFDLLMNIAIFDMLSYNLDYYIYHSFSYRINIR